MPRTNKAEASRLTVIAMLAYAIFLIINTLIWFYVYPTLNISEPWLTYLIILNIGWLIVSGAILLAWAYTASTISWRR